MIELAVVVVGTVDDAVDDDMLWLVGDGESNCPRPWLPTHTYTYLPILSNDDAARTGPARLTRPHSTTNCISLVILHDCIRCQMFMSPYSYDFWYNSRGEI